MRPKIRQALGRILLVYLLFGVAFVAASEAVMANHESDGLRIAARLLFLVFSAALLLVLVRRELVKRLEAEEQLLHAEQSASLARMAGGVAHDFNNLLTVILGYTEMVQQDLGPEHASSRDLEAVHRAGEQARSLVDQLLTLSRRKVSQATVIDPNNVIASLREVLVRLAGNEIELKILDFEVPSVLIDEGQLEQVILNLVINARDAIDGPGKITVATSNGHLEGGKPSVDLRVTDNGTGMDRAIAARCFEPFFTTKVRSEGTGMGLATVAAIVQQAGGVAQVDSVPDKGTTMLVQLPAIDEVIEIDPPVVEVEGGPERLLLVEDDERVRGFAVRVLTEGGYEVSEAGSGVEALDLVHHGARPHLVVTDVLMPDMGGVELAERLSTALPSTPVLFVSGYAEDPELHRIAGQVPFLPKPFSPHDLLGAVRSSLDGLTVGAPAQGSKR